MKLLSVGSARSSKFLIASLALLALNVQAHAQSLDITTRLTPWPPGGWPEGATGEVRLIAIGAEQGDIGLSFLVDDTGEVTYALPDTLADDGEGVYEPVSVAQIAPCDEVSPTLSPANVDVAILEFRLYANGQPWGLIDMSLLIHGLEKLEGENLIGLLYAEEALRVGGKGICPGNPPAQASIDLDLQAGRNFMVMQVEASYDGEVTMILTTTETLELPGTPVPVGASQ